MWKPLPWKSTIVQFKFSETLPNPHFCVGTSILRNQLRTKYLLRMPDDYSSLPNLFIRRMSQRILNLKTAFPSFAEFSVVTETIAFNCPIAETDSGTFQDLLHVSGELTPYAFKIFGCCVESRRCAGVDLNCLSFLGSGIQI